MSDEASQKSLRNSNVRVNEAAVLAQRRVLEWVCSGLLTRGNAAQVLSVSP